MSNNQPQEGNATVAVEKKDVQNSLDGLSVVRAERIGSLRLHDVPRPEIHRAAGRTVAAPLLIMGLYNKLVKTEGHDGSATESPIKPNH